MIYFDNAGTTKTDSSVLDSFIEASNKYWGNANSIHSLGMESKNVIETATKQIKDLLNLTDVEVIYTSGSTESNNLAIKGICSKYKNRGKHIITTDFEHSSIYGPISYLQKEGYDVDFVNHDKDGKVDIDHLKSLLRSDTILVSITAVNSEIGIINDISLIAKLLKQYRCFFHVDMTQSIGKININLDNIDLISFSAHKFFGIKGIGALIKKKSIVLEPIIHGGKSTTIYRSGTPPLPLIVSLARALRLILTDVDIYYEKIKELNKHLRDNLSKYDRVVINSNNYCSPYILNISVLDIKPETLIRALEEYNVYVSTQTACSNTNDISKAVFALTSNKDIASHSMRISLSRLSTKEECKAFLQVFAKCYRDLSLGDYNGNNKN